MTLGTFGFEHVNVIDVFTGDVSTNQTVMINGTKISSVGPSAVHTTDAASRVVDEAGGYLIPGFWDMHVHLIDPDTPGGLDVVLPMLVANGITGIRDLGSSSLDSILALKEQIRDGIRLGPRIILAGKMLDGAPMVFPPDSIEVPTPKDAQHVVGSLASRGADIIKAYEMLQPDIFRAIVEAAKEHGLKVVAHPPPYPSVKKCTRR